MLDVPHNEDVDSHPDAHMPCRHYLSSKMRNSLIHSDRKVTSFILQ